MPLLAVNAAESLVQLVLARDGKVVEAAALDAPGRANEHMAPAAAALLSGHGLAVADLGGVACVRGPGSFTGLRMSLAFCLGLARGAGLPMAGLDYLPLVAAGAATRRDAVENAGPASQADLLAVWVRSRTGQVYVQHFQIAPEAPTPPVATSAPTPLDAPRALALADAANELARMARSHGRAVVTGSGAIMKGAAEALAQAGLSGAGSGGGLPPGGAWSDPAPEALARAACAADYGPQPPEPCYLRLSDAEENLAAIAKARGLDPDEASRRLARATSGMGADQS